MNILFNHKKKLKEQTGFTLLELIIAIAILGILTSAITSQIVQLINTNTRSNNHMEAIKQVETSVAQIRQDVIMAQTVDTAVSGNTLLTMTWQIQDWQNLNQPSYQVTVAYSLDPNNHYLVRNYSTPSSGTTDRLVATDIQSLQVAVITETFQNKPELNIILTSVAGVGANAATETREFNILPRSNTIIN